MNYTKLFSDIIHSTVWREPDSTRVVWITMLAMANQHGEVMASIPGLADASRVTIEEVEAALRCFMSPDKYSRTPDDEGRRIEEIDGGWALLNYAKYCRKHGTTEQKQKAAERARRYRKRQRNIKNVTRKRDANVTQRDNHENHYTETETVVSNADAFSPQASLRGVSRLDSFFQEFWNVAHRKTGKQAAKKAFERAIKRIRAERDWSQAEAVAFLINRMELFAESPQARDEVKGQLHPATWLNQGRYDDDVETWRECSGDDAEKVERAARVAAMRKRDAERRAKMIADGRIRAKLIADGKIED